MRKLSRAMLAASLLAAVTTLPSAAAPQPGPSQYGRRLDKVGFDTLGPASTAYNTQVDIDAQDKFAYVGSLEFTPLLGEPPEGDDTVKAVDVSDPSDPTVTDAESPGGGDLGVWDVHVSQDILAISSQGFPESNPGVTLYDVTNPADIVFASHIGSAEINSPFGSHTNYLWRDSVTGRTWLFANGLDFQSIAVFDVTNPAAPVKVADYTSIGGELGYVHDSFVQDTGGRIFSYQAGLIGFEILDITRIVRGGEPGPLTNDDVVGFNYYTGNAFFGGFPEAPPVTRPDFAHYPEPTDDGNVTWVGDEAGCGKPAIVHSFDTSSLPLPPAKKPLPELGVIIENPDAPMCQGLIHAHSEQGTFNSQQHDFRWTGHNFDIQGDLLFRGDYGRGVYVYDISDPANPTWVSRSGGLNEGVGAENQAAPRRDKFLEHYPFIWNAVYDGDLVYASDINQGLYVLDLVGD